MQGLALRQAIGELQFAGFALCEAIRGVPTCRVLFCPKLLGDYHLKAPVLICLVSSWWGITICKVLFCTKLLGECGSCLVSSYWGITTCRVLLRVNLLWNYKLQGFAPKLLMDYSFEALSCAKLLRSSSLQGLALGNYNLQRLQLAGAIPVRHIS